MLHREHSLLALSPQGNDGQPLTNTLICRHWLSGLHSPWKYLLPAFHTCSPFKAGSASGNLYEKAYSYPRVSYPYCYSTYYNYCTQQKFTLRLMEHLLLEETCLLLCSSRFEIRDTEPSALPVVGQTAVNRARHCCWICTQTESALRCAFCSTGTLQTTIRCARSCFRRIEKAWSRLHYRESCLICFGVSTGGCAKEIES